MMALQVNLKPFMRELLKGLIVFSFPLCVPAFVHWLARMIFDGIPKNSLVEFLCGDFAYAVVCLSLLSCILSVVNADYLYRAMDNKTKAVFNIMRIVSMGIAIVILLVLFSSYIPAVRTKNIHIVNGSLFCAEFLGLFTAIIVYVLQVPDVMRNGKMGEEI